MDEFKFTDQFGYTQAVEDFLSRTMQEAVRVTREATRAASARGYGVTFRQEWEGLTLTITATVDPQVPAGEIHYPQYAWCTNGRA